MGQSVYIFLDEGGNFDFSPSGTKYFILTSVCKVRPFHISHLLGKEKYNLIEWGRDFEYFHCTYDNKYIRKKVFTIIEENIDRIAIDTLIVEKSKTGPALRADKRFYPEMLGHLLRYTIDKLNNSFVDEVFVITDTIPIARKRKAIEKAVKITLKNTLPAWCKFKIMHHSSKSSVGLQIADYCNWAIQRKWERGDTEFYDKIKEGVYGEFDIFRTDVKHYY